MNRLPLFFLALALLTDPATAQTLPTAPPPHPATAGAAPAPAAPTSAGPSPSDLARLTESNLELLQLLKKQQAVLEDIQFDRRLQSRQIQSLEERLQEALVENTQLQNKIATLEAAAVAPPPNPAPATPQTGTANGISPPQPTPTPAPVANTPPPPPATYLPPEEPAAPGTPSWHRLFTTSGTDNKDSDLFHVKGRQWRVLWHNQDKPGKAYLNTSALFIHAYPKDDTIPQEVCSKLGSGGDMDELTGPGNFYLKVEASGGNWELAVEDYY